MGNARPMLRHPSPASSATQVELRLLNAFEVFVGATAVELPKAAQRLVAFVALHERPVRRDYVAGSLWLDATDEHAAGNLRSTLWRVQKRVPGLLRIEGHAMRIDPAVHVDLHDAHRRAHDELCGAENDADASAFTGDLLPDWYDDDWVLLERERFRQLRLNALDALCERKLREGRITEALEAGLLAVAGEPLRESAHRCLIRVHLAAGNRAEAHRQYELCRRLLHDQLGIEPTPLLRATLDGEATKR